MHDDSILVAVEAALSRPAFCSCGTQLSLNTHDGAVWLECPTFAAPSRLPANVIDFLREIAHDRRHVVAVPETDATAAAA
jgi:hypothetical protein